MPLVSDPIYLPQSGDDVLYGQGGDDWMFGGQGNDWMDGDKDVVLKCIAVNDEEWRMTA